MTTMKLRLNPAWQQQFIDEVATAKREDRPPKINEVCYIPDAVKWLVTYLARQDIAFRVARLGAGVTRITTTEACPTCKGTGRAE